MFRQTELVILLLLPLIESRLDLYNTQDSPSVELYDCVQHAKLFYCRRPTEPLALRREQTLGQCFHQGRAHRFVDLRMANISVARILREWKSSIEMVEEYSSYLQQWERSIDDDKYLCQCTLPQSFGKYCEYSLLQGKTFAQSVEWQWKMRVKNDWQLQRLSDILCYQGLACDSGLLCLDWRDICDGVQQCMAGLDEDNCDLLEFNECDDEEYRCMNGMCIPAEYFLDGVFDCMDLSDEKNALDGSQCSYELASLLCDDRSCPPNFWSCGDGQCIADRLSFQLGKTILSGCSSGRNQYFMCETNRLYPWWTLPDGRCNVYGTGQGTTVAHRTSLDECIHFIQCVLSGSTEQNCPCGFDLTCIGELDNPCPSFPVAYPRGSILAPYIVQYYNRTHDWARKIPDFIEINGTIRCQQHLKTIRMALPYPKMFRLRDLEALLCHTSSPGIETTEQRLQFHCHNQSRTFNDRPYQWVDACHGWPPCLSAYRIRDGIRNCPNGNDETRGELVPPTCVSLQRHRFRCSSSEPTSLYVHLLGNFQADCQNNADEIWANSDTLLSTIHCTIYSKADCQILREYLQTSWTSDLSNLSIVRLTSSKAIPYRTYCDTFWNLASTKDEDLQMCREWWVCPDGQWRCATGQCIDVVWLLDEEWDCFDASDEEYLRASNALTFEGNWNLTSFTQVNSTFHEKYGEQMFRSICDLKSEWPCFRSGAFDAFGNVTAIRPCIKFEQIGDGRIDCLGGLDERNVVKHCNGATMLGNDFKCNSSNICIDYVSICDTRCPNPSDDETQCRTKWNRPANCSGENDFVCLNGQCMKDGLCDERKDCPYGEDEQICRFRFTSAELSPSVLYRRLKESAAREAWRDLQLRPFPPSVVGPTNSTSVTISRTKNSRDVQESPAILFTSNRGVATRMHNGTVACFCPPQYYGDKCQFHSDRLVFLFHLNFSDSIYLASTNTNLVLKLLVLLLVRNRSLITIEFHVRPAEELETFRKRVEHLLYPHSAEWRHSRQARQINRSRLLDEHPYSLRIEAYELDGEQPPRLVGLWLYPIYFDFLPSFRFAKVLRIPRLDPTDNPCSSNPCPPEEECYPLLNQRSAYACLCPNCSETHPLCLTGYCRVNALCKSNYRGQLSGDELPFCICPYNFYGGRCQLFYDKCISNPCQHGGTCLPLGRLRDYRCLCPAQYHGHDCEFNRQYVQLMLNEDLPQHRAAVVQYLEIDSMLLDLLLLHQQLHRHLPPSLFYLHGRDTAPAFVLAKLYTDTELNIHLLSIQFNQSSINLTTFITARTRCLDVRTKSSIHRSRSSSSCVTVPNLWLFSLEITPFEYHHLCKTETNTSMCLVDDAYLCLSTENRNRAECFTYDHHFDQCQRCLAGGRCLIGDPRKSNDFLCVCPRCHDGTLCQFNTEQLSFTLDSLMADESFAVRLIYLCVTLVAFLVGALTNSASYVTFQRPKPRQLTVPNHLLVLSVLCQCSLLTLLIKVIHIVFLSFTGDLPCKLLSFLLSSTTRSFYWLTSWITVERVYFVLFPFGLLVRKPRWALLISAMTLMIIGGMHTHELLFYISVKDPDGQCVCATTMLGSVSTYNRVTVLIHYIVPFCIQIVSITSLIVFTARSRSRTTTKKTNKQQPSTTILQLVKNQLNTQKELYLTPTIIVLSGLPQMILSFSFACSTLSPWQRHALLVAYFLSYAPQLLGFILFVLPSTSYLAEFRQTSLARSRLFCWTFPDSVSRTSPSVRCSVTHRAQF